MRVLHVEMTPTEAHEWGKAFMAFGSTAVKESDCITAYPMMDSEPVVVIRIVPDPVLDVDLEVSVSETVAH